MKGRVADDFARIGVELAEFFVNRITPPEGVQRALDERTGMTAVGDLDAYLKFKAAKALDGVANNGAAAGGLALGAGTAVGLMLPGMLMGTRSEHLPPGTCVRPGVIACPACHGDVAADSRFCAHCGQQMVVIHKCPRCARNLSADAAFCSGCGMELGASRQPCSQCGASLLVGTRFCTKCGEKVSPDEPRGGPATGT